MIEGIRIVVCIKQVLDPEAPSYSFRVDSDTRLIKGEGVPPVISPYDESALELALRIKEATTNTKITRLNRSQFTILTLAISRQLSFHNL